MTILPHQVINAKAYSKRCDLFSYGIVLWELVTHKAPFEGIGTLDILNAIVAGKVRYIVAQWLYWFVAKKNSLVLFLFVIVHVYRCHAFQLKLKRTCAH